MNTTDQTIIDTLVGHRITAVTSTADRDGNEARIVLDDGRSLLLHGSDGCGGCANGLVTFPPHDNYAALTGGTIMRAAVEDNRTRAEDLVDATIFVWVDDERLPLLDIDGTDNGWYGLGYAVRVLAPGEMLNFEEAEDLRTDACLMPGVTVEQR
jgi:hypothetical protein